MYDCFNMAYQDNADPLQLHIKINSENLLPIQQKYNAGSLRIPADPSWPKIPQRKLIEDDGGAIDHPCIITLTGTPRRSRTVVQTPLNQSPKSTVTRDSAYSSFHHRGTSLSMQTLKRLPGYMDPRFKKVTNIKRSQLTSTESLKNNTNQPETSMHRERTFREEVEKPVLNNDTNIKTQMIVQEDEKFHEDRTIKAVQNSEENKTFNINQQQTLHPPTNHSELQEINNTIDDINKNQIVEKDKCVKDVKASEHLPKLTVNDANTQVDINPSTVKENNGQLFFVLDKKMQSHPLNAIHVDTITVPQEYIKQCYNVQFPVLTYQNIPMQIASTTTNNVIQQCLNHVECKNQSNTIQSVKKEPEQQVHSDQLQNISKSPTIGVEKNDVQTENTNDANDVLKKQNNTPEESTKTYLKLDLTEKAIIPEKLPSSNIKEILQESSDSEYYIPNISKRNIYNSTSQRLKIKKILCNTNSEETTDSEFIVRKNIQKKQFVDTLHGDQVNTPSEEKENRQLVPQPGEILIDQKQSLYKNCKTVVRDPKTRNKSEQNLVCTKTERTRKLCRNSEPHITFKQKKTSAKFSRKARSYFQKNSHSALVDSDYTLMWPNCQYTKCKRNQTNHHKLGKPITKKINQYFSPLTMQRTTNEQIDNTLNFVERNCTQNKEHLDSTQEVTKSLSKPFLHQEHYKCETSPRSNADDLFERSKTIPAKTQELLNKSYWEYYNKLKHKMRRTNSTEQQNPYHLSMKTLEKGKRVKPGELCDKELRNQIKVNPELQTLQQCTALSTMINKALDSNLQSDVQTGEQYLNNNVKSASNRMVNMQSMSTKKISNSSSDKLMPNNPKCNKNKTTDKQFLELKSIIFFGGMMYILIIFLPMLYDYFYYEEYDYYENLSYMELIVDYVLSSFKEAFGGAFNGVKQIFFYPVRLY